MKVKEKPLRPRKAPVQARAKQTLEWILAGAARVFRAEGFGATTNRIAHAAGVSIGTLYEYFPNKESLLVALAEQHVQMAERGVCTALATGGTNRAWLAALQAAIVASHRYPSQAIDHLSNVRDIEALRARVNVLRDAILTALIERAKRLERARSSGQPEPEARALVVFGVIAELSSRAVYTIEDSALQALVLRQLLDVATAHLG